MTLSFGQNPIYQLFHPGSSIGDKDPEPANSNLAKWRGQAEKEAISSLFSSAIGAFSTAFRVSFNILATFLAFPANKLLAVQEIYARWL